MIDGFNGAGMTEIAAIESLASPFNGPVEVGLRVLMVLDEAFPQAFSLQRLVIYDYLIVHSDDVPGGPPGLHAKTPYRASELSARRPVVQSGLVLYQSRGLVEQRYEDRGLYFSASDRSSGFLDAFHSNYSGLLRRRAEWLVAAHSMLSDDEMNALVRSQCENWGTEFVMESVLWNERAL